MIPLPGNAPDNDILGMALTLQQDHPCCQITLVSKDINLRIKAAILGIHAEDYYNDQALDDVKLLYSGARELPADFWDSHGKELDSWQERGRTFYRVHGPDLAHWHPNQGLFQAGSDTAFIVRQLRDAEAVIVEILKDHTTPITKDRGNGSKLHYAKSIRRNFRTIQFEESRFRFGFAGMGALGTQLDA